MKKYKFITNQVSGVPKLAIRDLDPAAKNTKTWLKLGHIEEVQEKKPTKKVKSKS